MRDEQHEHDRRERDVHRHPRAEGRLEHALERERAPLHRQPHERVEALELLVASPREDAFYPSLGHLGSYARIAIHIREFSPKLHQMAHCTRNKIAHHALEPVFS